MAGDRGLAFVVIGLIGVSAFWVSNQRRVELRPAHTRAAQIDSEQGSRHASEAAPTDLSDGDLDETFYVFRMRGEDTAMLGTYPELRGSAADVLQRIRQRLRLTGDAGVALPLD